MSEETEWAPKQDMSLLCRVCANQHDYLIPIFQGEGLDHDMPTKMDKHLPIKVRENDKLPTQMCYQCASTIIAWSELHTNCLAADKKLKGMLKINEKKSGEVDNDDAASDHYEDSYDDGGGAGADDDEDFEQEIKQLISDAGVELGQKTTKATKRPSRAVATRKRKAEVTITPVKREPKKLKTEPKSSTALLKPKEEVVTNDDRCDLWSCCMCCGKFCSPADLSDHIALHNNSQTQFSGVQHCFKCKNTFESHCVEMDSPSYFICWYCYKALRNKQLIEIHLKVEHGQIAYGLCEWYFCKQCKNVMYSRRQDISRHMRSVHQIRGTKAKTHLIKFIQDSNMPSEVGNESCSQDMKEYACDMCFAKFNNIHILEAHINIEHGKQIYNDQGFNCYSCRNCCKLFMGYEEFVAHKSRIHGDVIDLKNSSEFIIDALEQIVSTCKCCSRACLFKLFCDEHDAIIHIDNCNEHPESHSCESCNELFSNCNDLWIHLFSQHIDETLYCNLCEKKLDSVIKAPSMLMKHWRRVHTIPRLSQKKCQVLIGEDIKYLCFECKLAFSTFESLKDHFIEKHEHSNVAHVHYCALCDKYFSREQSLRIHCWKIHSSNRALKSSCSLMKDSVVQYKCPNCDISVENFSDLEKHIARDHKFPYTAKSEHTNNETVQQYESIISHGKLVKSDVQVIDCGVVKYKCPLCYRMYTTFYELKRHFDIHSGERKFSCHLCTKTFFIRPRLSEHIRRVHKVKNIAVVNPSKKLAEIVDDSGNKKYKCNICSSVFNRYESLKVHKTHTHSGERPYVCDVCGTSFAAKKHLTRHINRTHSGVGCFQCNICGRFMNDSTNFKDHLDNHKGEKKYTCEICGAAFGYKASLHHHKFTHSKERMFQCAFCAKKYVSPKTLKEHERSHENVKHACETCGNEFNTRKNMLRHSRTHRTERPFVCEYCNVAFKERKYLLRHYKVHKI